MSRTQPVILVVDDAANNRLAAHAILSPRYRVLEAPGGLEALALLEREPVDLVLLDVNMPRVGGLEVCRRIKGAPREQMLPVLLLSAAGDQHDRNAGLLAGADDFLTKPFNVEELLLRVQAFLTLRSQDAIIRRQLAELKQLQTMKDDLVALLVHDMRNPLTALLTTLQIIDEARVVPADYQPDLDTAVAAAQDLRGLVNGVLEARALEEARLPLRKQPARLRDLAEAAAANFKTGTRRTGIAIREQGSNVEAAVDRGLVQRAVENLLSNAIRYSPAEALVEVSIRTAPGSAIVAVADRGPGVPDGAKQAIFEKFESEEVRAAGVRRGFGLGLHLVKLVMESHGGQVQVRDRDDGGAVFELAFPSP